MTNHGRGGKILVTTTTLPRFSGDPEPRFVLDLSKELQKSFDVTILAPADPRGALRDRLDDIDVVRYRYAFWRSLEVLAYPGAILPRLKETPVYWGLVPLLVAGLYRAVRSLLRENRYDCVHCHWLLPQGIVQAFVSEKTGPPFIVTSHGADAFALDHPLMRPLKRYVLGRAAAVTVVSQAIREKILTQGPVHLKDKDIHVIPMGVDLGRFTLENRDPDWAVRLDLSRPVILFVGRLSEKKGLTYLLHAMSREPLRSTTASLAIIGDGPLRTVLAGEAESLGLGARVRFLGPMDHRELPVAYASADIFAAPSIVAEGGDREGLPTVLCEAAASGLPAIATRISGIPEVVRDGETGILVDEKSPDALGAALTRLVNSSSERTRMGQAARFHIQGFDWTRLGERYRALIAEVVRSSREKAPSDV